MVPDNLKHATITPVLKTPNSNTYILSNFRPISNLPFMSKILENVVLIQLQTFLCSNHIYETFQSGFRKLHSTESALIKVLNDILLATDSGNAVALILLDLSSAFDLVNHNILISHLKKSYWPARNYVRMFRSFLTNRKISVLYILDKALLPLPICLVVFLRAPFWVRLFLCYIYYLWG